MRPVAGRLAISTIFPTFVATFSPSLLATFLPKLATFLSTAVPSLAAPEAITTLVEARTIPAVYIEAECDVFDRGNLDCARRSTERGGLGAAPPAMPSLE